MFCVSLTDAVTFDREILCVAALFRRVENVIALENFHALRSFVPIKNAELSKAEINPAGLHCWQW